MQVPDEIRKCTAFLLYQDAQGRHLAGTVFFVGLPVPGRLGSFVYAVTAKHVIDGIRSRTTDTRVYLRLNIIGADVRFTYIDLDQWHFHPDSSVDVAVAQAVFAKELDHLAFPITGFVTDAVIEKEGIGIGDEVFLSGLFIHHTGQKKNIPIVRVGNIAAMPEEPIRTTGFAPEMEAYLIESRSVGGLSGSPVFVHLGLVRAIDIKGEPSVGLGQAGTIYLLGLMHGHWDLPISELDSVVSDGTNSQSVNTGIAIVVPAKKIVEVINHPELELMRKKIEAQMKKQSAATMDTVKESDVLL